MIEVRYEYFLLHAPKGDISNIPKERKHRVFKAIYSAELFFPILNRNCRIELHSCMFEPSQYALDIDYGPYLLNKGGIRNELKACLSEGNDFSKRERYFICKVFDGKKELPEFYGLLAVYPFSQPIQAYVKLYNELVAAFRKEHSHLVESGSLDSAYFEPFSHIRLYFAGKILEAEAIDSHKKDELLVFLDKNFSEKKIKELLNKAKGRPIYKMFLNTWKSYILYLSEEKGITQCPECKKFFASKNRKKYCTSDCGKLVRDRDRQRRIRLTRRQKIKKA